MYDLKQDVPMDPNVVGGKAHHLMKLNSLKIDVPGGFCLPTEWTTEWPSMTQYFKEEHLASYVRYLAKETGKSWNKDTGSPLVVSVRSGAPISMPGMMDTILNVGLTRDNLDAFAKSRDCEAAFVHDSYRRLIQMYGVTAMGIPKEAFNQYYDAAKIFFMEINETAAKKLVDLYERVFEKEMGYAFPDDANEQLLRSVDAVFSSWSSQKAIDYRALEDIDPMMGTAVVVQEMVFGNTGSKSGTGVVFSHDPNTGAQGIYGDFLVNAQGEDVVAGTHKTLPISKLGKNADFVMANKKLHNVLTVLHKHYKDIVDVEFTIENQTLWILQARIAKRSRRASVRVCIDMVRNGTLLADEATDMILDLLPKTPQSKDVPDDLSCVGKGVGVTEGSVSGRIAIGKDSIQQFIDAGEPYVYVATETAPEDITQMKHSCGVLTAQGGTLSHAAIIARGWNLCCVVGFEDMKVMEDHIKIDSVIAKIGDWITIDGATGQVYV